MDILLSKFVDKYINKLSSQQLNDLYEFLNLEDEVIYNSYQNKMMPNTIKKKNDIHEYFLNFKI